MDKALLLGAARQYKASLSGQTMRCNQDDILDNIRTSVIALNQEMRVVAMNNAAENLLESSEQRSLKQPLTRFILNADELLLVVAEVNRSNSSVHRRGLPLTLLSGREVQVDIMVSPASSAKGGYSLLIELQPVDRLLKISREESLVNAQETTQEMIRGLAHEIKNPLGGVRGAAQLLARELPDESLTEYTNVIIREADRLRDLVDRLLGPNQQLNSKTLNIHEVLEHVLNLITAESNNRITVSRDYDPSLPDIFGDFSQLIQAVLNIMRNALQVSPSIDDCVITVRSRAKRQFTIGSTLHRLVCRIDIEDNGPGIPEEMLQTIFMPMVTGRPEGTGLGLTIAQSIVGRHGGLLECDSEPGKTRFTLYLPLETQHA